MTPARVAAKETTGGVDSVHMLPMTPPQWNIAAIVVVSSGRETGKDVIFIDVTVNRLISSYGGAQTSRFATSTRCLCWS